MNKSLLFPGLPMPGRLFNAADAGAGGAAPEDAAAAAAIAAAAGGAPAAAAAAPAAKWWDGADYAETRAMIAAKGFADDDMSKAMPKIVKSLHSAEQRIGRGLDSIIDKPAKDQSMAEYMRANAATFGLPEKEDGYTVEAPDFWPKDTQWDEKMAADVRKLAFDEGLSPSALKGVVGLYAQKMKDLNDSTVTDIEKSREVMMKDLQREFGDQTDVKINAARQAADHFVAKAGLPQSAIDHISGLLKASGGDAYTIKLFASIHEAMGEDAAVGLGKGGPMTMTPADARAEIANMTARDSDYSKAVSTGNRAQMAEFKARMAMLTKIASG